LSSIGFSVARNSSGFPHTTRALHKCNAGTGVP
jgi:hypothetical protein